MQTKEAVVRAAIDIGSNTTHLVIARCWVDNLDILADDAKLIRTGESVNKNGELSTEIYKAVLSTLNQYKRVAVEHEAQNIVVVATEALREAHNVEEFLTDIERETGLAVQLISGKTEAVLTFYGATYALDLPDEVMVADVGGGSTELILARRQNIRWLTSLPLGSGRLHDTYLTGNPPARQEVEEARKHIKEELRKTPVPASPQMLICTGTSAQVILRVAQQAFQLDEQCDRLTYEDLLRCEGLLGALPAKSVAQRYNQALERARILPGGELLIQTLMEQLGCEELRVTGHGLREGVLLAYTRYGDGWLEQPEIQGAIPQAVEQEVPQEAFVQFMRKEVEKRTSKLLDWRGKVLKQDEAEPVHKMRVASRRLRAVMDAYETTSNKKPFKKAYREVKQIADVLGAVRDADVLIKDMQERFEHAASDEQAGIHWFIERLYTYHKDLEKDMDALLQNLDDKDLQQKISASVAEGEEGING